MLKYINSIAILSLPFSLSLSLPLALSLSLHFSLFLSILLLYNWNCVDNPHKGIASFANLILENKVILMDHCG